MKLPEGNLTIRKLRRMADLTQGQLAATLGVHAMTVNRWERGQAMPSSDNLLKLAAIFGLDASKITLAGQCTAASIPGQVPIGDQAS